MLRDPYAEELTPVSRDEIDAAIAQQRVLHGPNVDVYVIVNEAIPHTGPSDSRCNAATLP